MAKTLCGTGCRGDIVRTIQAALHQAGLLDAVDGVYGRDTKTATSCFQQGRGLAATGEVDELTWTNLFGTPAPDVRQRSLQVTAAFEGHRFGLAQGNFDGAGITWGIIGFTLKSGEIQKILQAVQAQHPELVAQAFGDRTAELLDVFTQPWPTQLAWATALSSGPQNATLAGPWRTRFASFGAMSAVQREQMRFVEADYFAPARKTAAAYKLRSELGLALAFDSHVQNGGIGPAAAARIAAASVAGSVKSERDLRIVIANAVADNARSEYQDDVRARKLTLATGEGHVHGMHYVLSNWGLDERPAPP